jgi:hypothetical protein
MNIDTLIDGLVADTVGSLRLFSAELVLCGTILALLLARLVGADRRLPSSWIALGGALVAFGIALYQFATPAAMAVEPLFTGLLVYDQFTVFFRVFLLLFLILTIALTVLSGIPDQEDSPDFYTLLFGSVVGMLLMVSANHLLILFIGMEMASVPSFVMVGFLKGRRPSSEAALKFVVYGAGAAGVARDADGWRVPGGSWERITREAGIVHDRAEWHQRLEGLATDLRGRAEAEQADDEPREWLINRYRRSADHADALHAAVRELFDRLDRARQLTSWRELSAEAVNGLFRQGDTARLSEF